MILVTGASGFIGSAFVWHLNQRGVRDILLCDRFGRGEKWCNLRHLEFVDFIHPSRLFSYLRRRKIDLEAVVHLGACSDTGEEDMDFLFRNNVGFSQRLWEWSAGADCRFIYASSAATYGDGRQGFEDDEARIPKLNPLNKYGYSKQFFDRWALEQNIKPPRFAGLKFFNVFGPNEYHKGSMASVLFHAYRQIQKSGKMRLFKSYRSDVEHGRQQRDFVYIKDVTKMIDFFLTADVPSGIYNIGAGEPHTFLDFITAAFDALGRRPRVKYIAMPKELRSRYQYYTCAPMEKLRGAGYVESCLPLKEAVKDYIVHYLTQSDPYLK